MAPKVIFFTGAPLPSTVNDTSSCTIAHFDEAFTSLLDLPRPADQVVPSQIREISWRALPLSREQRHLKLDLLRDNDSNDDDTFSMLRQAERRQDFFTSAAGGIAHDTSAAANDSLPARSQDVDAEGEDLWTQFCEESLAQHTSLSLSLSSSQVGDSFTGLDNTNDTDEDDETSFQSTTLSTSRADVSTVAPPAVSLHLSDLEDVPSARRILALQPQTVTLNLIAGVISVAPPRPIVTRWGQALALVEVLIGDDTAAGFAVTFWLPAAEAQAATSPVARLRRQDVVLLENVALHVFRSKVYGQSLRKGLTRVSLLWRHDGTGHYSTRDLDRSRAQQTHPQQEKARLVKDWVLHFVGRDPSNPTVKKLHDWDKPPEDTQ